MGNKRINLRIPGPTPLPSSVLQSLSRQMINHRASGYEEMHKRIVENLRYFYGTKNEIYLLTSSGMGGLESSIVNFYSTGDKVLFLTCGEFGNRWAEIAKRYKLNVIHEKLPPAAGFDKDNVEAIISKYNDVKGVFITLNETSSGVLNKIPEIAEVININKSKPLFSVDAISALGAVDLPMDSLGIDLLVSASQKAWMAPPGIAMVAVSGKAWERYQFSDLPKYYFDLKMFKEYGLKNQTPATPAVTTLFALDKALFLMKKETKVKIFKRHLFLRDYLRSKLRKNGFELYVEDDFASPTVTSIRIPSGIDGQKWLSVLRDKYDTVVAGGMGETKGKIIRIAHMGFVSKKDLDNCLIALISAFRDVK